MYVGCTVFATCTRLLRPVSSFEYEIRLLRVSDLLRTYTTCALEATYAYKVYLLRVSEILRMLYVFCARGDLRVRGTFLHERDLCFKFFDLPLCDELRIFDHPIVR